MDLIIGRDAATSRLQVVDKQTGSVRLYGNAGSVPMDVSRQHCEIIVTPNGTISIKNIKAANVTFVNGVQILSKNLSQTDNVQLGNSRFTLNWQGILNVIPPTPSVPSFVNIGHLQNVWDNYNDKTNELNIKERKLNALSRVSGIFSMLAIASGFLLRGQDNTLYFLLYGIAILLTLGFTIVSYINASKIPEEKENLKNAFMKNYICPNPKCHRFLGFTHFSVLSQNTNCPYCKIAWK